MWTAPPPAWNQTTAGNDPADIQTANAEFKDLYSIYSTSQFSNLTINKVTEQENATFQCKLQVGGNAWAYNIRVEVTGKNLQYDSKILG